MPRAKGKTLAKKAALAKKLETPQASPSRSPDVKAEPSDADSVAAQAAADRRPLGSVDVDSLSGEPLRAYARRAGVLPRDVLGLTEDRLRQNTKLVIANHFELLTE